MQALNAVLFDLDGTLIDTNEVIIASYTHAYQQILPELDTDRSRIIDEIGPPLWDIFGRYAPDSKTVDRLVHAYHDYYKKHEATMHRLYPNVIETLKALKKRNIKIGIVTTKRKSAAQPSIDHYGLNDYFDVVIGYDDVTHPKPHKEPVEKALIALNHHSQALMVGDNQSDILSGQAAGVLTAGVAWSIKGRAHLEAVNPDYILTSMEDCLTIVDRYKEED